MINVYLFIIMIIMVKKLFCFRLLFPFIALSHFQIRSSVIHMYTFGFYGGWSLSLCRPGSPVEENKKDNGHLIFTQSKCVVSC